MTAGGGWASGAWALAQRLAYIPADPYADPERAYAIADAWTPPHPQSLPGALCDRIRATAASARPIPSGNGTYYMPEIDPADRVAVIDRFTAANDLWWGLDINEWYVGVKSYRPGERHTVHQDLHAGAARRKLAGVVQLSDPDDYTGGALVVHFADQAVDVPRAHGTLVAFPGWTVHEVHPITSGTRWSLCVNGWGPPLR